MSPENIDDRGGPENIIARTCQKIKDDEKLRLQVRNNLLSHKLRWQWKGYQLDEVIYPRTEYM